ncbi:MAG: SDR family NAD(P)-dependent oxidoreductase [Candidatus Dormibacteria bacterium]
MLSDVSATSEVIVSQFRGCTAIVTGAASGIGREIAAKLLAGGAWVAAADRDASNAPEGSRPFTVDVSDDAQVRELVAAVVAERGRLDIMCNNAGIESTVDVVSCSVEEWDRVFAVNSRGVFLGCKYAVAAMLESGGGVIVNTASVAGMIGLRDRAAYCASKAAVIGLTKQVAVQYADRGIRCNCVCPGTVDSPWVGRLLSKAEDAAAARAQLVARQPLGRLARPDEIASAVCYLASDEAAFMTGSELVIDGGILAG